MPYVVPVTVKFIHIDSAYEIINICLGWGFCSYFVTGLESDTEFCLENAFVCVRIFLLFFGQVVAEYGVAKSFSHFLSRVYFDIMQAEGLCLVERFDYGEQVKRV